MVMVVPRVLLLPSLSPNVGRWALEVASLKALEKIPSLLLGQQTGALVASC